MRGTGIAMLLVAGASISAGCSISPATVVPAPTSTLAGGGSTPSTSAAASSEDSVAIDASLLGLLPVAVAGSKVQEDRDAEIDAADATVPADLATSVAAGVAVDLGSGDLVYAVVVKLRNGALNDDRFRAWRDTFDEGACSGAGSVSGHAETVIAERQTFVGTCTSGLHTYHTWLKDRSVLVSAASRGEKRMGEQLIAGLRP